MARNEGGKMRLKNKKTGEIVSLEGELLFDNEVMLLKQYSSLADLNTEWEDVPEEPKEHWYINEFGTPTKADFVGRETLYDKCRKDFGNYFKTKEEAEKAVEKLKAFANLRKRGLKFNGWDEADRGMVGEFAIYCDALELDGIERELEIVFGREEL